MRGYFTFILVFVSAFLILTVFEGYLNVQNNYSKEISIEKNYQVQLNLKYAILEAARQGAKQAFLEYALTHPEQDYNIEEARQAARKKAYENIIQLSKTNVDPDSETVLWCGYVNSERIRKTKTAMLENNKIELCEQCTEINNAQCENYVNVDMLDGGFASVWLGENNAPILSGSGVVGISVYSKKFGVAGIGFIPQNEKGAVK